MNEIFIRDEFIRLDSALKFAGVIGTGGQAKMVIQEGLVLVNGEVCTMRGKKLRNGDTVKFEEETFVIKNEG
ncbi:MAG: RNA-binding S4 domain-containing protein [Clostridia bacterium]|nr:RNA-binding S4 domain-containing protein [Clostridia bacterium]